MTEVFPPDNGVFSFGEIPFFQDTPQIDVESAMVGMQSSVSYLNGKGGNWVKFCGKKGEERPME